MKCLKEPLARLANRHDKTRGAFSVQRFKTLNCADASGRGLKKVRQEILEKHGVVEWAVDMIRDARDE